MLAADKHFSLLLTLENYGCKKFYNTWSRRVRARQRAALIVKRQESGAEKASSKDSAYGYSGGETSRLHTREPTPGANVIKHFTDVIYEFSY